eukprot:SAG31_NODE_133_length_23315_cov_4.858847_11_plen_417_part_00
MCIVLIYHHCGVPEEATATKPANSESNASDDRTGRNELSSNGYRCIVAANHDGWLHRISGELQWLSAERGSHLLGAIDQGNGLLFGTSKLTGKFAVITYNRTRSDHFGVVVPDAIFYAMALIGVQAGAFCIYQGYFSGGDLAVLRQVIDGGISLRIIYFIILWVALSHAAARPFKRRSRGQLVTKFLSDAECDARTFAERITRTRLYKKYGGFHMIVGDIEGDVWYLANRIGEKERTTAMRLPPGIYSMGNEHITAETAVKQRAALRFSDVMGHLNRFYEKSMKVAPVSIVHDRLEKILEDETPCEASVDCDVPTPVVDEHYIFTSPFVVQKSDWAHWRVMYGTKSCTVLTIEEPVKGKDPESIAYRCHMMEKRWQPKMADRATLSQREVGFSLKRIHRSYSWAYKGDRADDNNKD